MKHAHAHKISKASENRLNLALKELFSLTRVFSCRELAIRSGQGWFKAKVFLHKQLKKGLVFEINTNRGKLYGQHL
jgi:hypothetical protein